MNRHRIRGSGLFAAIAAAAVVTSPASADVGVGPSVNSASGNAVIEWDINTQNAVIAAGPFVPHAALLNWAIVQGAVYDAVNGIVRTHQPYLVQVASNPGDSQDAAAATAAYRVLVNLYPAQVDTLQSEYNASLAAIPDGPAKQGGISDGEQAAAAMITARQNDGRNSDFTIVIGTQPGQWRPTPPDFGLDPAPWAGNVRPFLIPSAAALRSDGPNALTSGQYAMDVNEVKSVGSRTSTTRTPDQTDAAKWWALGPTAAPVEAMLRSLATGHGLSTADTARLFAQVHLATADALIVCHNDKYYWNFWRPITAIREADTDGNPQTTPDPNWTPLLDTPPFPEHSSGHACHTSAWTHTLANFFGTDKVSFSGFNTATGTTRSFTSFSQALKELIDARVWGGIHFRTADTQGAVLGNKVARYLKKNYFQPVQ